MSYTQLTQEQRYAIYVLKKRGKSQTEIAETIGVHKSTVSREIRRNTGGRGYRYKQAHRFALKRRKAKANTRITEEDWAKVEDLIEKDWSPEQISGRLDKEENGNISHEWIYQYVWKDKEDGGDLHEHLRAKKKYRKRSGSKDLRGKIKNKTSIEERLEAVDEKDRTGDWEADTVIGKNHKGALVTMVERKNKYALIGHVKRKTADGVLEEQVKQLKPHKGNVLTITQDNGKEFASHEKLSEKLELDVYFAHPYSSWERGLSENTNGLFRQYFPKNRELHEVKPEELEHAVDRLNHRPRKSLNYRTPHEAYYGTTESSTVALGS
ncbi:IS30 family transposase [Candidatus Bipolaricaulota bacterium]|nr:IS30 family transposase [Candidatus Bipolaricaulota bacterium]